MRAAFVHEEKAGLKERLPTKEMKKRRFEIHAYIPGWSERRCLECGLSKAYPVHRGWEK